MALLVASNVASAALTNAAGEAPLRFIYALPNITRLDVSVARAREFFDSSEQHLAFMAIPFMLSVHGRFLAGAMQMLADDGRNIGPVAPADLKLETVHEAFASVAGANLPDTERWTVDLELFHLLRYIRIRLVHHAALAGERVIQHWKSLSGDAKQEWERLAGKPFTAKKHELMALDRGDLIAALAVTKHLADAVNIALARTVSRARWATIAIDDYIATSPERFLPESTRMRRLMGHARHKYGLLDLTQAEIEEALQRSGRSSH
jgi:hypothetical protein